MKIDSNKVRILKGLRTQTELAKAAGLTKNGLSAMLIRGQCSPESVVKLASALGVSPREIILDEREIR